jgi:hypothetical protein
MTTMHGIRGGDRVTYRPFGAPLGDFRTARAVPLLCFAHHVIVDGGGQHGRPIVVNENNYISHKAGK